MQALPFWALYFIGFAVGFMVMIFTHVVFNVVFKLLSNREALDTPIEWEK